MKILNLFIGVFILCSISSCNNFDDELALSNEINHVLRIHEIAEQKNLEGGIEAEKTTLSETDALKVAKMFHSGSVEIRSGNKKSVKQLMSVSGNSGEPLMYIVNYDNNRGYVIVSATKNAPAILAFSDEGNFDDNYLNTGLSTYIDEFKYSIKEVLNKDIDSLRVKYALSWYSFENEEEDIEAGTRSSSAMRQQEINKWTSLGYSCQTLTEASLANIIGATEAAKVVRNLSIATHPDYDPISSALLLVNNITEEKGPMLQTTWNQGSPFNVEASNGSAGCWTIALAQLMKYHHHPTTYNWNNIPVNPSLNNDVRTLALDIRNKCNAIYDKVATNITTTDAVFALNNHFRYNATLYNHTNTSMSDYNKIRNSLANNNPVLMRGHRDAGNGSTIGHAWVAHGYKEYYTDIKIAYVSGELDYYGEYTTLDVKKHHYLDPYLIMNWGWGYGTHANYINFFSAIPTGQSLDYSLNRAYIITTKK